MDALDRYLSAEYTLSTHWKEIGAPRERVWEELLGLNLRRSRLLRILFASRGLRGTTNLAEFQDIGFRVLSEKPPNGLVIGLIGQFWTPRGGVIEFEPDEFTTFDDPGYARAVWGFQLDAIGDGRTLVTTETRVQCTDPASSRAFRRYWRLVAPFSGLTRMEMLRLLRRSAEHG